MDMLRIFDVKPRQLFPDWHIESQMEERIHIGGLRAAFSRLDATDILASVARMRVTDPIVFGINGTRMDVRMFRFLWERLEGISSIVMDTKELGVHIRYSTLGTEGEFRIAPNEAPGLIFGKSRNYYGRGHGHGEYIFPKGRMYEIKL